MSVLYFPGCTLKNKAASFDRSMVQVMSGLGVELQELPRWNCCGVVFSMTTDDLMLQMAPIRILLRAEQNGGGTLLTPCSMCYNTLRRSQMFIKEDPEHLRKLHEFMYDEETQYQGTVDVVHPLVYLRDTIGFDRVEAAVEKPLAGLKLAAYYGCMLMRPDEVAIDHPGKPKVMGQLLESLGAQSIDFDKKSDCCGSYQTLTWRAVTTKSAHDILLSAHTAGAEALVTSCPLCAYNLDQMQREAKKQFPDLRSMPVFYFSELMALALGCKWEEEWTALHQISPQSVLEKTGLA